RRCTTSLQSDSGGFRNRIYLRGYIGGKERRARHAQEHMHGLCRDTHESSDGVERHSGNQSGFPSEEGRTGSGQHLHVALLPATNGGGRRHGGALDNKIPQRPQRWVRWSRGLHETGTSREIGLSAKSSRGNPLAV